MKIPPSDSSNSEISTLVYATAIACIPTATYIVAKRALGLLSSEETASKYAYYCTVISAASLMGYSSAVFGGSLIIFLIYCVMNIPSAPRNSLGVPIWNPQMSCVIADKFIEMIEKGDFVPTEKFYRYFDLEAPEGIQILDRFAYQPYKSKDYDHLIKEIAQRHRKNAGSSVIHILQRLDTPLLEGIAPTLLEAYKQGANGVENIKPAIENLEKHRLLLLRKVISHLHFVSQKPDQYNRSSQQLAEIFESLLFGTSLERQDRIMLLKSFIENPALYSLDNISPA